MIFHYRTSPRPLKNLCILIFVCRMKVREILNANERYHVVKPCVRNYDIYTLIITTIRYYTTYKRRRRRAKRKEPRKCVCDGAASKRKLAATTVSRRCDNYRYRDTLVDIRARNNKVNVREIRGSFSFVRNTVNGKCKKKIAKNVIP